MMKRALPYLCIALLVGCGRDVPPRITIHVGATGAMSIDGHQVTADALEEHCTRLRTRYGLCPVIIRGEEGVLHADIRSAMHAAAVAGQGDIAYATSAYATRTFPRYMSSWRPREQATPYGPAPEGTIYLVVTPNGCNTAALATATTDTKVAVFCNPGSQHRDLVQVLQQCEEAEITTVYVGTVSRDDSAEQPDAEVQSEGAPSD